VLKPIPFKQYTDSLGYQLTKAKIRVLTSTDSAEVWHGNILGNRINARNHRTAHSCRYGMGLVALNSQKFDEAEATFQHWQKNIPYQAQNT